MTIHGFLSDIHDFGRLYEHLGMYDKDKPSEADEGNTSGVVMIPEVGASDG